MPTLFEIRSELLHVNQLLEQLLEPDLDNLDDEQKQKIQAGEFTDEQKQKIQALLAHQEETQEAEEKKLQSILDLIKGYEAWSKVRKEEAKRIAALAVADENRAKGLKNLLLQHLQGLGVERIRLTKYNLKVSSNGGVRKLVYKEGFSALDLPENFQKVSVDFNGDIIREYLEAGHELDFAYLEERGVHLRIS